MRNFLIKSLAAKSCAAAVLLIAGVPGVGAAPLDLYAGPTITDAMKADQRACLNIGDAVSCSAPMLNLLSFQYTGTLLSPTAKTAIGATTPSGFIVESPQGGLKQAIVLGTGGNAATDNGDTNPTPGKVEDGYKTNNAGDNFAGTGKTGSTGGNLGDPNNNGLLAAQDSLGTWDVDIAWLLKALTVDGWRRELMILFDYNQEQNSTGSVDYWALITARDLLGSTNKANKSWEINNNYSGYNAFTSTKGFDDQPNGNEFGTVNTKTCYQMSGNIVTNVAPTTTGTCPAGTWDTVNNATGDSTTEIIAFLPELNASLEQLLADGYDTISVRMLFGCFNNSTANDKAGKGYLSGGATTNCDGGGNVDVYLLAGQPMHRAPEPGSLALAGLSMLGLGVMGLRRRRIR